MSTVDTVMVAVTYEDEETAELMEYALGQDEVPGVAEDEEGRALFELENNTLVIQVEATYVLDFVAEYTRQILNPEDYDNPAVSVVVRAS